MADELLEALAKRQRDSNAVKPPIPLDDFEGDAGDALLDDLFGELDDKAGQDAAPSESPPPQTEAVPDNVTALSKRSPAVWAGAGILLAAAAALVLWFAIRAPAANALPTYNAVAIAGGPTAVRGHHDAVADRLELKSPEDTIDWKFSAASPVAESVAVSLLATSKDGQVIFAGSVDAKITASGSARLHGPLSTFIELIPGRWTVEVVFSGTSKAPSSADEVREGSWQRLPIEVIILPS